jgi:DNA-binding NarL/FixJ family response regulator
MNKIFLLDDETLFSNKLIKILEDYDFEVIDADNYQKSLDALDQFKKDNDFPSIGIFDIYLPGEDKTGLDVAKLMLEHKKMAVIILTNQYDNQKHLLSAKKLEIPTDYFLHKRMIDNEENFIEILIKAQTEFLKRSMSEGEYLARSKRKIAIRKEKDGPFECFGKDEIVYVKSEKGANCSLILSTGRKINFSRNIGLISAYISSNFLNFIRIDSTYFINLEKMLSAEGDTLYLAGENHLRIPIHLSHDGKKVLKREHVFITTSR